jgi:putative addiction module component (TIGR02574 family)
MSNGWQLAKLPNKWHAGVMSRFMSEINRLSSEERLKLLEELWNSLCEEQETVPVTDAQRAELDRRLDDLEREGPVGIPWQEVADQIRKRSK